MAFLARKAKTLLVPYYVFSLYFLAKPFAILLIPAMRAAFQTSHDYGIAHQFLDVLVMGNGLWFLMAFFVGECLMYGLTSLTDDGRVLAAIGMAFVILSTFVSSQTGWPALPFQIVAGVKAAGFAGKGRGVPVVQVAAYLAGCFVACPRTACAGKRFAGLPGPVAVEDRVGAEERGPGAKGHDAAELVQVLEVGRLGGGNGIAAPEETLLLDVQRADDAHCPSGHGLALRPAGT